MAAVPPLEVSQSLDRLRAHLEGNLGKAPTARDLAATIEQARSSPASYVLLKASIGELAMDQLVGPQPSFSRDWQARTSSDKPSGMAEQRIEHLRGYENWSPDGSAPPAKRNRNKKASGGDGTRIDPEALRRQIRAEAKGKQPSVPDKSLGSSSAPNDVDAMIKAGKGALSQGETRFLREQRRLLQDLGLATDRLPTVAARQALLDGLTSIASQHQASLTPAAQQQVSFPEMVRSAKQALSEGRTPASFLSSLVRALETIRPDKDPGGARRAQAAKVRDLEVALDRLVLEQSL